MKFAHMELIAEYYDIENIVSHLASFGIQVIPPRQQTGAEPPLAFNELTTLNVTAAPATQPKSALTSRGSSISLS